MKRIVFILCYLLFIVSSLSAQDSRGRITSTIIADGLAELPAKNLDVLEQVMSEIAGTGAEGAQQLAAMLGPSAEGKNARFLYAIDGLTSYVVVKGRETECAAVKKGLEKALKECTDEGNRVFLQDQIKKLTPGSVKVKHSKEKLSKVAQNSRTIAKFRDKVVSTSSKKQPSLLIKTLESPNRSLRTTALEMATELGVEGFDEQVVKKYSQLSTDAKEDVLRWFGNTHNDSPAVLDIVIDEIPASPLSSIAIESAGKIGDIRALNALVSELKGKNSEAAVKAIRTFNGPINSDILDALPKEKTEGNKNAILKYSPLTQHSEEEEVEEKVSAITLSDEEQKAGFELLFDGTNLDKWKGNKTNYVVNNGVIDVTAHFGSEGNLYTAKKYSDFVFRFEFCFVRPGINNGVGIRTREGVDAAYEGMEIQILDHDDPIYKDLRPYQQHGSVYGIIVPEHVKFGELGTWNTEEIRAEGDHITVTVNGRVILDGNIREACKGHNMSPEAGKPNPYTVDHRDHPGLFNPDGLICFCGHGEGLKLRNIRILDLSGNGR